MTEHKPPQAMTLFDLIARTWALKTEVRGLAFNASGSALSALEHTDEAEPLLERAAAGPEVPTRVRAGPPVRASGPFSGSPS